MAGETPNLSKTDLRRGLFTASPRAAASAPAKRESATGSEEQLLLFGEAAPAPDPRLNRAVQKRKPLS